MKQHLIAIAIASVSLNAAAGMEEKIAQKQTIAMLDEAKEVVLKACGNSALEVNFDWSAYDAYDYAALRYEPKQVMTWAGALGKRILEDMADICTTGEYADLYKAEIAKIKTIQFTGQSDQSTRSADFSLQDTALDVALNASSAYNSKNKDLLKKVW